MTSTEQISELYTYCEKHRIDFGRLMEEAQTALSYHLDPADIETHGWVEWIMHGK